MCGDKEHCTLADGKGNCIQSRKQPSQTIGIILAGGSQRSYVTERICDTLNLPVAHSESLTINPFGSNTGIHQQCKVVNLCMGAMGSDDVTLSAICVPVISSLVQGQCPRQAMSSYYHLAGLPLADDC